MNESRRQSLIRIGTVCVAGSAFVAGMLTSVTYDPKKRIKVGMTWRVPEARAAQSVGGGGSPSSGTCACCFC